LYKEKSGNPGLLLYFRFIETNLTKLYKLFNCFNRFIVLPPSFFRQLATITNVRNNSRTRFQIHSMDSKQIIFFLLTSAAFSLLDAPLAT
jgi:hypothetical protein